MNAEPTPTTAAQPDAVPRIEQIELHRLEVPLVRPFETSFGRETVREVLLVRVRTEERPLFMNFLIGASGGQIFAEGGGMLIRDGRGDVIGAVGVTGDTEARDEELAAHGIRAAGLKTDADCAHLGKHVRLQN